jgi:hypothetical protein
MRSDIVPGASFPDYELSECSSQEVPARLGYHNAGNEGGMETRPQRSLLSVWQDIRADSRRARLKGARRDDWRG